MADRLPQYAMGPSAFNTAMLQQQQQLSQTQQQSQLDTQSVPAFPNQELGRPWQQTQHMQNSYPADMQSVQVTQRMMEQYRNQGLTRPQPQQQMGQPFAFTPQQMSASAQQQPFLDSQRQMHMQPKFPNMGMPNSSQLQQPLNSRNAVAQTAFPGQNPGSISRLDLINMAPQQQQQQSQNAQLNYTGRIPQQQGAVNISNQPSQEELFPNAPAEGIRRSPSHATHQPAAGSQATANPRRPMTFFELRDRAAELQRMIQTREAALAQFSTQRGGMSETDFLRQMQIWKNEVKSQREMLAKVLHAMNQVNQMNQMSVNNAANVSMDATAQSQQQQQQQQQLQQLQQPAGPVHVSQNQPQWSNGVSQQQPSQPAGFGGSHMGQTSALTMQNQPRNVQPSPLQMHSQPNSSHPQQNMMPSRSVHTPQLLPGHIPQPVPNAAPQFPYSLPTSGNAQTRNDQVAQAPVGLPPLDKATFDAAYKKFSTNHKLQPNPQLLSFESRLIDLHSLHVNVMSEGGYAKVNQKEFWPVIGARLGFVQFPASDTEPAKSGPAAATRLAHIYQEYIQPFDNAYLASVLESRRKLQAGAAQPTPPPQAPASRMGPTPQQLNSMLIYAFTSAEELRRNNVSAPMIQFIEANREQLQSTARMTINYRSGLKSAQMQAGPSQESQDRRTPSAAVPFASQQNPGLHPMMHARHGPFAPQQNLSTASLGAGNNVEAQFSRLPQLPMNGTNAANSLARMTRVSQEQMAQTQAFIAKIRADFIARTSSHIPANVIPDDQRLEFDRVLEVLQRLCSELDGKLPLFCVLIKHDDIARRVIAILVTVTQQKAFLKSQPPKYIVDLSTLHAMVNHMQTAIHQFHVAFAEVMKQQQQHAANVATANPAQAGPISIQQRASNPPHVPVPPTQLIPPPANRSTPMTPITKKAHIMQAGTPSNSTTGLTPTISADTPPPPPAATTPVANPQTPTHTMSSPQGSRSPRTKSTPKPKPTKRKASKSIPASEPSPIVSVGGKRPREEELPAASSTPAAATDSPPKRIKTEADAPSPPEDEALAKKREEVENVKTEEETIDFVQQMTEWVKLEPGQQLDIFEALSNVLLQGYGSAPDGLDSGPDAPSSSIPAESTTGLNVEEFNQFFDFTSYALDDDARSKAPTPDLIPSSSANPSPESGSEAEAVSHNPTSLAKVEHFDLFDSLRLGSWKEIDGGEAAYHLQPDWKWDSPMPALDQPWAVFT